MEGFAKKLLMNYFPKNGEKNCTKAIETTKCQVHEILGKGYDLFGDQSIIMFPLPGHAAGQHGALIQTEKGPVFLVADAFKNEKSH